jgi:elongator complex protein 3
MRVLELIMQEFIKSRVKTQADLASFKRKMAKRYQIPCSSNIHLLKAYHELVKNKRIKKSDKIEILLRTRPVRSLSGIVNVSVLTKPYPCPGKCLYCPTEKGVPKSYLSGEPAVERAKRLKYGPYLQVKKRIEMLENEGHPTDKIDLRIIGGTWSYYPTKYQSWFIKRCFDACNEKFSKNLGNSQKLNEKAKHRIVGISVETRPDFINEEEIKRLRGLGVTRVELGVQSIYDDVLKLNLRGHGVKETILATKLLKDAGIKICYQMMPNLPGSNLKRDEKMFEELFNNSDFQPDYLKIYPCALVKEATLYRWWKQGKYKPYTKEKLIQLVKKIKKRIPYYVRIQRITRDIPSQYIIAGGAKISNLRQIILKEMGKDYNLPTILPLKLAPDWKCKCIRCREIRENYTPKEKLYFFRQDYEASGGKEIFLSFENKKRTKLFSFLRLRVAHQKHFLPVLQGATIIREVQTLGQLVSIGKKKMAPQHRGLGKKLIKEAEKITKKGFGLKKIAVISGVGVRDYFKKMGYNLSESYMIKKF